MSKWRPGRELNFCCQNKNRLNENGERDCVSLTKDQLEVWTWSETEMQKKSVTISGRNLKDTNKVLDEMVSRCFGVVPMRR